MNFLTLLNAASAQVEAAKPMSDALIGAIIPAVVSGIISIIGFIVTNNSMKKNFRNELLRQRDTIALEKMATMPLEILALFDKPRKPQNAEEQLNQFNKILNTVYSYGSADAIKIAAFMQRENFLATGKKENNAYRVTSLYILLVTQIKYDITGIVVCPELWFQTRLTDYATKRNEFKAINNRLVTELNLNKGFIIPE